MFTEASPIKKMHTQNLWLHGLLLVRAGGEIKRQKDGEEDWRGVRKKWKWVAEGMKNEVLGGSCQVQASERDFYFDTIGIYAVRLNNVSPGTDWMHQRRQRIEVKKYCKYYKFKTVMLNNKLSFSGEKQFQKKTKNRRFAGTNDSHAWWRQLHTYHRYHLLPLWSA